MNEDLKALAGNNDKESTEPASESVFDISALFERFGKFEEKLDKVIRLMDKDIKVDETNEEKIGITEAEGKINEHENYREPEKESE